MDLVGGFGYKDLLNEYVIDDDLNLGDVTITDSLTLEYAEPNKTLITNSSREVVTTQLVTPESSVVFADINADRVTTIDPLYLKTDNQYYIKISPSLGGTAFTEDRTLTIGLDDGDKNITLIGDVSFLNTDRIYFDQSLLTTSDPTFNSVYLKTDNQFNMQIRPVIGGTAFTADRTLTFGLDNGDRKLTLQGDVIFNNNSTIYLDQSLLTTSNVAFNGITSELGDWTTQSSKMIPIIDLGSQLGSLGNRWLKLFILDIQASGTIDCGSLNAPTGTITCASLDTGELNITTLDNSTPTLLLSNNNDGFSSTGDSIYFYTSNTSRITMGGSAFRPTLNHGFQCGATDYRWSNMHTDLLTVTDDITVGGTVDGRNISGDGETLDTLNLKINQSLLTTDNVLFNRVTLPNGSISAPSLTVDISTKCGWYSSGDYNMSFAVNNSNPFQFSTGAMRPMINNGYGIGTPSNHFAGGYFNTIIAETSIETGDLNITTASTTGATFRLSDSDTGMSGSGNGLYFYTGSTFARVVLGTTSFRPGEVTNTMTLGNTTYRWLESWVDTMHADIINDIQGTSVLPGITFDSTSTGIFGGNHHIIHSHLGLSRLVFHRNTMYPTNDHGDVNNYDLGITTRRFDKAYIWTVYRNSEVAISDSRHKNSVNNLVHGLAEVEQLRPISYKYNDPCSDVDESGNHLPCADPTKYDQVHYGFIAQEAESVFGLVDKTEGCCRYDIEDDIHGMDNTQMVPILVKAIQELSQLVKDQRIEIDLLKSLVIV